MDAKLESSEWRNVQDPVKQMITAITKAVRTQSAGMKDLDKRLDAMTTIDLLERRIAEVLSTVSEQVTRNINPVHDTLKKKVNISDLSTLEKNTISMAKQLDKINELLHSQNSAILNLNDRLTKVARDVEDLKNPSMEKVFQYIDGQTKQLALEIGIL